MINQIICAAVIAEDNRIFRGHRHSDCIKAMSGCGLRQKITGDGSQQGFMDSLNEYRTREEAMQIHKEAGQYPALGNYVMPPELYSEDLY